MSLRAGTYIVPTHRWYIERTVWLIAGFALLTSTALALLVDPLWILGVTATGLVSINVALTGFCPIGNILKLFRLHSDAGLVLGETLLLSANRSLVSRAPHLHRGGHQYFCCLRPRAGGESMVDAIHDFRRRRHGLVRGDRLLHHGQRALLAWRRTSAQSRRHAVRPL